MNFKFTLLGVFMFFSCSVFAQQGNQGNNAVKAAPQTNSKSEATQSAPASQTTTNNASTTAQPVEVKPTGVPADYPVFVDTGNPEADKARYNAEKKAWIEKNPEAYRQLSGGNNPTEQKQKITRSDLNALPAARKDYILAHPELFEIID